MSIKYWPSRSNVDVSGLLSILKPYPAEEMNSVASAFSALAVESFDYKSGIGPHSFLIKKK